MTIDYDSIIEFENEHSGLDFKAIQYTKDKYPDLLKDVIAMANAKVTGYRLIIIGMKLKSDGTRDCIPINPSEFIDSATYEQLVHQNIEPEIDITYFQYSYKNQLVGILRLGSCMDQPYMMKKDHVNKLMKGTCLIRKGSHQMLATRSDYERIYEDRQFLTKFHNHLDVSFMHQNTKGKILKIQMLGELDLPSSRMSRKIQSVINQKKHMLKTTNSLYDLSSMFSGFKFALGGVPYEERSIETLQKDLEVVRETYAEDDVYELFEHHSLKLNFNIINSANEYVQDASCTVQLPEIEGILIFDKIINEPVHNPLLNNINLNSVYNNIHYPSVERREGMVFISQGVGDIKHHLVKELFKEDIRIAMLNPAERKIQIKLTIFAKNLPKPFEETLTIFVEDAMEEQR